MRCDYAQRARALVGTRFRLQGRGTGGVDCVGLVLQTYGIPADGVRRDYRLKDNDQRELEGALTTYFRRVAKGAAKPGDVLLVFIADQQLHLAVKTEAGFVHAHAGLKRVVETPGEPEWPLVDVYRKRTRNRSS